MTASGIKPTRIDLRGIELADEVSITGSYTGDDVDWDSAPGVLGFDQWKQPVRAATTAAITIATALNAGDTLDGVTLAAGDRVLVKDQGGGIENGIYVVDASPYRAPDLDEDAEVPGAVVYVIAGTANAGTAWAVTSAAPVVDTDAIDWAAFGGGSGTIPAGTYELATEGGQSVIKTHGSMGAAETFDPTDGNVHTGTLDADCTFTLNAPTGTGAATLELWLTQDGTGGWDITWPGSVTLQGTLDTTASTTSRVILETIDGGTSWVASVIGGAGSSLTVKDEGTPLATAATSLDFVGAGVTATGATAAKTITIPGYTLTAAAVTALGFRGELLVADITGGDQGAPPSSYVEMTTQRTTTSATLEDITGVTTTITLVRTSHIAVWLNCEISATGVCDLAVAVSLDGTDHDTVTSHLSGTDIGTTAVIHRTATPFAPGTYTVKGRFKRASGGSTPAVDRADLLVMGIETGAPVLLVNDAGTDFLYTDL